MSSQLISGVCVLAACARVAAGDVIEFDDKAAWEEAVETFATADFTGFPSGTPITEQYADLGIHFTDGDDLVNCCSDIVFPEDGAGMDGNGNITVTFDVPMRWIAADFPGRLKFELYLGGRLVYESSVFGFGGPIYGEFAGLVSDEAFDMAILMDNPPGNEAEIDDLHFGGAVPAPPAFMSFIGLTLTTGRRRRR